MISQCTGQRRRMLVRVVSATGLVTAAVFAAEAVAGSPVAAAGPAAVGGAQGVINMLTSEGYRVIVTKVGGRDIEDCTVRSILTQTPVQHLHTSDIRPAPARDPEPPDFKIAYVTLNCA
ncbi:hypothetical protein CCUG62472_03870 [Mycobacteroides salmoniphilum]|uniref:PASTA domain-containing protein n=1 Tax=Mycobacteroides salmoniphilum TaxID=404941 RepID=A0A4V3I0D4_9MYCO|nr:hypothetical protein CCUG62472_03870 [Mycobacteroides salmoniphilum]TEA00566.1 hypothetical protein CCUG60884_04458 [Mycobacteroides salmoniphilum]